MPYVWSSLAKSVSGPACGGQATAPPATTTMIPSSTQPLTLMIAVIRWLLSAVVEVVVTLGVVERLAHGAGGVGHPLDLVDQPVEGGLIHLTVDGWSRSFRYRWADVLGQTLHNRRGRERTCRDRRGHLRHLRTGVVAGREDSGNRCPTERINCDGIRRRRRRLTESDPELFSQLRPLMQCRRDEQTAACQPSSVGEHNGFQPAIFWGEVGNGV